MSKTVFERKIYQKMLEWKKNFNGSTALLIKGARRVGKSTVAEEFAKTSNPVTSLSIFLLLQRRSITFSKIFRI